MHPSYDDLAAHNAHLLRQLQRAQRIIDELEAENALLRQRRRDDDLGGFASRFR
jgi:hypothetical protein